MLVRQFVRQAAAVAARAETIWRARGSAWRCNYLHGVEWAEREIRARQMKIEQYAKCIKAAA